MAITNTVQNYFDRVLLLRAMPFLSHMLYGRKGVIPANAGNTVKWVRINSLPIASTPLIKGVNPDPVDWGKTEVEQTIEEYGAYAEIPSIDAETEDSAVLNGLADAFGSNAGETMDVVLRDKLLSGTSVLRAGAVSARDEIVTVPTYQDCDRLMAQLATGNAQPITSFVPANGAGTIEPVEACYPCITHPHMRPALEAIGSNGAGFIPVRKYTQNTALLPGEFGAYGTLRFCASTAAKVYPDGGGAATAAVRTTGGTNADVYAMLAFGREAYGVMPLRTGQTARLMVKSAEQVGGALSRYSTVGWVACVAAKILNDAFMARLEACATR